MVVCEMSGSGGGRGDEGSGPPVSQGGGVGGRQTGGGDDADPCLIVQSAPLNSPKADVLNSLNVGDELQVNVQSVNDRQMLVVVTQTGEVVGSLTHRGYATLLDCIVKGYTYKAVLTRMSGGINEVEIRPEA